MGEISGTSTPRKRAKPTATAAMVPVCTTRNSAQPYRNPTSGGIANCTTIMKTRSVLISRAGGRHVSRFGCRNSSHVTIAATDSAGRYVLTIKGIPAARSTANNANAPTMVAG